MKKSSEIFQSGVIQEISLLFGGDFIINPSQNGLNFLLRGITRERAAGYPQRSKETEINDT